jgi:alpha-methylacyl-CoA racemase
MTPLDSLTIIEFEGLGPAPLAGWMLAALGARVTLISRPGGNATARQLGGPGENPLQRGKTRLEIDLKQPAGRALALAHVAGADALIEGNRPGVMERLGLGPDACAAVQPRLVYGRMTGWGQSGPLAHAAGHDLNYVALSGMLSLAARRDPTASAPLVPPTVLGDAGGALGLALGIVSGVLAARQGGPGCVVDAAIVDIVALLGNLALWLRGAGQLDTAQATSVFHDSPFYEVYRCADGGHITLGALEAPFYALLLQRLGLHDIDPAQQHDTTTWPVLRARLTLLFHSQPRDHWCALLEGSDACFAPVLSVAEAARHPHNLARKTFGGDDPQHLQAAMAPRFLPLR